MDIDRKLIDLIPENMAERGRITIDTLLSPIRDLMNRRQFPDDALSELQIELILQLLSSMDSDKDPKAARVGEREGRIASPLLGRLSAGFNHGVGRSGHLTAAQPKAPGASLMQQLANQIATDAIRKLGLGNIKAGLVTPLSTGMTIALTLSALRQMHGINAVVYPRVDHTSPKRAIALSGLTEISVPTLLVDDRVEADLGAIENHLRKTDQCAVLATTTFFPPRVSDPIKDIAKLCAEHGASLVVNNAYGIQSAEVMESIRRAIDAGRVDAVVQSCDKNFLTPVGASVIVSPTPETIENVAEAYAGRASAAPIVQTLAALLLTGAKRYEILREEQIESKVYLESKMSEIAESIKQRILKVDNAVACAITMDGLDVREVGARLYNLRVTGPRAVEKGSYGSSIDNYPHSYLVMNAAIGARKTDVEQATIKLYKELNS
ncbi:MAG: O-phosphoseryl-tRNA(Sec) selenium transferase [Candidatus Thorarchaeota archaeon]